MMPTRRRRALRLPLIVALLGLAGCASTPPVTTESAPGESVATRATFGWDESGISWPDDPRPGADAELVRLVHDAVGAELVHRGYREAADGAELAVSFHATVRDLPDYDFCVMRSRVIASDPGREVEVCRVYGPGRPARTYRKGTLIVFVVDRAHGVLLWQGVAEGQAQSLAEARVRLRGAVARMFRDFPARAP
jgi:hypothetical protein